MKVREVIQLLEKLRHTAPGNEGKELALVLLC
jgi:hypothetical protein